MRTTRNILGAACLLAVASCVAAHAHGSRDPGRETLHANDGWAASGAGVDGLIDITNASDLVTASWNRFRNHDKLMLIGSSDSATADRGKLRVTLHHNHFDGIGQRAPRVRNPVDPIAAWNAVNDPDLGADAG